MAMTCSGSAERGEKQLKFLTEGWRKKAFGSYWKLFEETLKCLIGQVVGLH